MKGPKRNRKFTFTDWIMVLLGILLIYMLYQMVSGHGYLLSGIGDPAGDSGPLGAIAESLSAFGQGLRNAFSGILR